MIFLTLRVFIFALLMVLQAIIVAVVPFVGSEAQAMPFTLQSHERAEQLIAEGVAALERNDPKSAQVSFQRALTLEPKNVTAHTYLGVLADQSGDLREAERHFAIAAINDPLSPAVRNNHGAVLMRLGRFEQAAKQFEVSLRLDPKQPSALVNLAQIRFASGTPESLHTARELFARAQAIAPDAEIARSLVVIALRQHDPAEAVTSYAQYAALIGNSAGAINANASRAELGAALLNAHLAQEAATELQAVVNANPTDVAAIIQLARAYQELKDIQAAGRTLESAIARGVEAAPVYAALVEIYVASGHVENAIPAMRLAIQRDPQNENYRFRYAMLLTDTKAPAAAVIRLEEALKTFPRSAKLWFALGVAQSALDKNDEAAKALTRAIEIDPKFAPAYAYLGMVHDQQGQYASALTFYERALAIDDKQAGAHYLAAEALMKQETTNSTRAETHLKRAIALDPLFNEPRLALALLYLRADRLNEAAAQLETLIAGNPRVAQAHYHLGRIYTRLKRPTEAQSELALFKKLSEDQKEQTRTEQKEIARRLANVIF
jgi:Tfp pilus assembly protein PilF